jgi:hypothetical protein
MRAAKNNSAKIVENKDRFFAMSESSGSTAQAALVFPNAGFSGNPNRKNKINRDDLREGEKKMRERNRAADIFFSAILLSILSLLPTVSSGYPVGCQQLSGPKSRFSEK